MSQYPVTSPSLLLRLRDGDNHHAWSEFVQIYTPLIFGFSTRHGLQAADAEDVTQEVFASIFSVLQTFDYNSGRGRFRTWLLKVTQRKMCDYFRRLKRYHDLCSETAVRQEIQEKAFDEHLDEWERDYRRQLFEVAATRVQQEVSETTWAAFRETTLQGRSGREVAEELGLRAGAVYVAKSRVVARLKDIMDSFEAGSGRLLSGCGNEQRLS